MKNLASAAKGSGVSVPSASRLNTGHWRESGERVKTLESMVWVDREKHNSSQADLLKTKVSNQHK